MKHQIIRLLLRFHVPGPKSLDHTFFSIIRIIRTPPIPGSFRFHTLAMFKTTITTLARLFGSLKGISNGDL